MIRLLVVVMFGLIVGCATPHRCELTNESGYCTSVAETYTAARANGGDRENVLAGVADPASGKKGKHNTTNQHANVLNNDWPNLDVAEVQGKPDVLDAKPVYTPPRVWRMKVFAWKDKYDILHSGEYLYFNTPGYWNYGSLREPGAASQLLAPITPEDMGFQTPRKEFIAPQKTLFEE